MGRTVVAEDANSDTRTRSCSSRAPRVAVLMETTLRFRWKILEGIQQYALSQGHWGAVQQAWDLGQTSLECFRRWSGDGMIARIEGAGLVRLIRGLRRPTVDLLGRHPIRGVPVIHMDNRAAVRLALDHLQSRGIRRFAYCGNVGTYFSDERERHFRNRVARLGLTPNVYPGAASRGGQSAHTWAVYGRELAHQDALLDWIDGLPKPIGVLCSTDMRGSQVLRACAELGVEVPRQVAVIGINNDEFTCELCDPPLSSVDPNAERIGFESAALLNRLMQDRAAPPRKTLVPPAGVVSRASTGGPAQADPEIAAAVRFIREHGCDGIAVEDVVAHVPMSRRSLERGFRSVLGSTPNAEIIHVRLERVKELLAETDYTLAHIARLTGFQHAEYMSRLFREKTEETPGEYRKRMRLCVHRSGSCSGAALG